MQPNAMIFTTVSCPPEEVMQGQVRFHKDKQRLPYINLEQSG